MSTDSILSWSGSETPGHNYSTRNIDTRSTTDLAVADRRLNPGEDLRYPVNLSTVSDIEGLRRSLLRSMGKVGRAPGKTGSGNSRKRTRLIISIDQPWTAGQLADSLAAGRSRVDRPLSLTDDTTGSA